MNPDKNPFQHFYLSGGNNQTYSWKIVDSVKPVEEPVIHFTDARVKEELDAEREAKIALSRIMSL